MKANRDLIAYNDLKKIIIDPGFCTLCGACVAACPVGALKIEKNELCYVHDCSEDMQFCPICYDVCPYTEALLLETLGFVTEAPNRREGLGHYRKLLFAQAADEKIRRLSHGGGVVTALLKYAIEKKIIDGAVISESELKHPAEIQSSISLIPDDVLVAVKGKLSPGAVATAFGKAVHEYGKTKIAFVGTPCTVLALRKLESWEHKIMDSLKIIIGLMCLWSFSLPNLIEYSAKKYDLDASKIQKITLDDNLEIHVKDRVLKLPIAEAVAQTMLGCRNCIDFTAELADISIGGAGPLENWSTVIIRSKMGEELFEDAVKDDVIHVKSTIEPDSFAHLMTMATRKKKIALGEIAKREKAGLPVPPSVRRLTELLPRELQFLSSLTVNQVMSKDVMTILPETTVDEILNHMTTHHHMGYPVVDEEKRLVGIVTFEDVSKVAPDKRSTTYAQEIANKRLITMHPEDSVLDVYTKMIEKKIGRVLIVERDDPKRLVGIVTRTDVMHMFMWPMRLK
jgi:coenzyme F420 hydrogenase subunit beta